MDKPIIKNRQTKKEKVESLTQKIGQAKSIIFTDYHGLSASQIASLRSKIKEAGGEATVAKNTLLRLALHSTDHRLPTSAVDSSRLPLGFLTGPTAVVFAYNDALAPLKEIAQSAKMSGVPKFKFGFLGKDFLDAESLEELAKIPPKEILHAKVIAVLSSPLYGIIAVLQANINNLVSVLNRVSEAKVIS